MSDRDQTRGRAFENNDTTDPGESHDEGVDEGIDGEITLEELSQSYARALGGGHTNSVVDDEQPEPTDELQIVDAQAGEVFRDDEPHEDQYCTVTPLSILEAVLLVGRPDNSPLLSSEIASLMRGVKEAEIEGLVAELNRVYRESGRALMIVPAGAGYRMQLAEDLSGIKDRFYGRVRDIRLNQAAIDCLALVSYQPGISRTKLEEQRGQPSGAILNQLVRRQLLEMRREGPGKQAGPHYYPTERLLQLAGLASLEDLPQAEELD